MLLSILLTLTPSSIGALFLTGMSFRGNCLKYLAGSGGTSTTGTCLALLMLSGLCYQSFYLTRSTFLLYTPLLLNCEPTPSICQLLPLYYSIGSSLLPILLSSLCLFHISLHQNSPKSLSLYYQVIELLSLLWQVSQCLLLAQGKILLLSFDYSYFLSSFFPQFGAPCSEMTRFFTIIAPPRLPTSVHIHYVGVSPWNV